MKIKAVGLVVFMSATMFFSACSNTDQEVSPTDNSVPVTVSQAPLQPQAISPGSSSEEGVSISTLTPTLHWSGGSASDTYIVEVSKIQGNQLIEVFGTELFADNLTLPSWALEPDTEYVWWVYAYHGCGPLSPKSNVLYFNTCDYVG